MDESMSWADWQKMLEEDKTNEPVEQSTPTKKKIAKRVAKKPTLTPEQLEKKQKRAEEEKKRREEMKLLMQQKRNALKQEKAEEQKKIEGSITQNDMSNSSGTNDITVESNASDFKQDDTSQINGINDMNVEPTGSESTQDNILSYNEINNVNIELITDIKQGDTFENFNSIKSDTQEIESKVIQENNGILTLDINANVDSQQSEERHFVEISQNIENLQQQFNDPTLQPSIDQNDVSNASKNEILDVSQPIPVNSAITLPNDDIQSTPYIVTTIDDSTKEEEIDIQYNELISNKKYEPVVEEINNSAQEVAEELVQNVNDLILDKNISSTITPEVFIEEKPSTPEIHINTNPETLVSQTIQVDNVPLFEQSLEPLLEPKKKEESPSLDTTPETLVSQTIQVNNVPLFEQSLEPLLEPKKKEESPSLSHKNNNILPNFQSNVPLNPEINNEILATSITQEEQKEESVEFSNPSLSKSTSQPIFPKLSSEIPQISEHLVVPHQNISKSPSQPTFNPNPIPSQHSEFIKSPIPDNNLYQSNNFHYQDQSHMRQSPIPPPSDFIPRNDPYGHPSMQPPMNSPHMYGFPREHIHSPNHDSRHFDRSVMPHTHIHTPQKHVIPTYGESQRLTPTYTDSPYSDQNYVHEYNHPPYEQQQYGYYHYPNTPKNYTPRLSIDLQQSHSLFGTPSRYRNSNIKEKNVQDQSSSFSFGPSWLTSSTQTESKDLEKIRKDIEKHFKSMLLNFETSIMRQYETNLEVKQNDVMKELETLKRKNEEMSLEITKLTQKNEILLTHHRESSKELNVIKAKGQLQDSKILNLQEQLNLKVQENLKLAQLCDELINNLESSSQKSN